MIIVLERIRIEIDSEESLDRLAAACVQGLAEWNTGQPQRFPHASVYFKVFKESLLKEITALAAEEEGGNNDTKSEKDS